MSKVLIGCDLDGTVMDDRHRLHLIRGGLRKGHDKYHAYHMESVNDQIYPLIFNEIMNVCKKHIAARLEFWTARNDSYRQISKNAIESKIFSDDIRYYALVMRDNNDWRSSPDLKGEWLINAINDGWDEIYLLDDRLDVINRYVDIASNQIRGGRNIKVHAYHCKDGLIVKYIFVDEATLAEKDVNMKSAVELLNGNFATTEMLRETVLNEKPVKTQTAADILDAMAATFRERNAVYGDNAVMVGQVMKVLFPNGVELNNPEDYHMWHLFELKIVKLTRFAISGLKHEDSIHDDGVYSAMCERLVNNHNIIIKK